MSWMGDTGIQSIGNVGPDSGYFTTPGGRAVLGDLVVVGGGDPS